MIYLDSAATTHMPESVVGATSHFSTHISSSVDGFYAGSADTVNALEAGRSKVAEFIGASSDEVIFVAGATDAFNQLAVGLSQFIASGQVVVSQLEHHANMLPWSRFDHVVWPLVTNSEGFVELGLKWLESNITPETKVVAVTHVSNTLGHVTDIQKIVEIVKSKNPECLIVVDGAQAVGHIPVDVVELGCDFYVFSAHKMYGPQGIGVVYAKAESQKCLESFRLGGKAISSVEVVDGRVEYKLIEGVKKYEPGTPNVAGVVGLAAAIDFIQDNKVLKGESELVQYLIEQLKQFEGVKVYTDASSSVSVVSFGFESIDSTDVGMYLARQDIAVRVGNHCTQPLLSALGVDGTVRVSFGHANTKDDIDSLIEALKKCVDLYT